jgi:hypothetical protein
MMSKSDGFALDVLRLVFQAEGIRQIAEASPICFTLWLSMHTKKPVGSQRSHEVGYSGYQRGAVDRNKKGWKVDIERKGPNATSIRDVVFEAPDEDGELITHIGVGTERTGLGQLLYVATLENPIHLVEGKQPYFGPGDIVVRER